MSREQLTTGALLATWRHSAAMNIWLAKKIPPNVWTTQPNGHQTRSIAAMFAHLLHIQQVTARTLNATSGRTPALSVLSQPQLIRGLTTTADLLTTHVTRVLTTPQDSNTLTLRRTINKLLYLMTHDAHHRGQILLLAHTHGLTLSHRETMKVWRWK